LESDEFAKAVASGDQRLALEAVRDRLVEGVLAADDRRLLHLAPLSKQLVEVLEKIDDLPAVEGASKSDDLRARRAARIANAAHLDSTGS
jgi:hypothetical protein